MSYRSSVEIRRYAGKWWARLLAASWLLLAKIAWATGCRSDLDCPNRHCLYLPGAYAQGQCADWVPSTDFRVSKPEARPRPLATRKPGDSCELGVDCLPGYRCYFKTAFTPPGICLPAAPATEETGKR